MRKNFMIAMFSKSKKGGSNGTTTIKNFKANFENKSMKVILKEVTE